MSHRNHRANKILGAAIVETLEGRQLLTASPQISFANFSSTTGLVTNGYGSNPTTASSQLVLTDGANNEARTVFYGTKEGIDTFSTSFTVVIGAGASTADGFTFTVQGQASTALGTNGGNLGYTGITPSVAAGFNFFDDGVEASGFGFVSNGQNPDTITQNDMTPINLHSGDPMAVSITYNGTTLAVNVVDEDNNSDTYSANETVNIPSIVGGNQAFVGFTASTGANESNQAISNWSYTGTAPPTLAVIAQSNPSPVTNLSSTLTALGDSVEGEPNLTYTWSTLLAPNGAKAVLFSDNGDNSAQSVTARYYKAGQYHFRCTITDQNGQSVVTDVSVRVNQVAKQLKLSPHKAVITIGNTEQYTAVVLDQFNHPIVNAAIDYSIQTGGGVIDASTGLYTTGDLPGHLVIEASFGSVNGTAGAVVLT
jgi:hypothetical protein